MKSRSENCLRFFNFPQDLVVIFQRLVMILPRFFDFERLSPQAKIKKSESTLVAMNMMNECAKFHNG